MEWNIRGGVVEDAAALTKLNREELGYDYPEAKTREHLAALLQDPSHKILVAEIGEQVVGSALLAVGKSGPGQWVQWRCAWCPGSPGKAPTLFTRTWATRGISYNAILRNHCKVRGAWRCSWAFSYFEGIRGIAR